MGNLLLPSSLEKKKIPVATGFWPSILVPPNLIKKEFGPDKFSGPGSCGINNTRYGYLATDRLNAYTIYLRTPTKRKTY
jgi:hypothetical protein